jgi:hypothetical protein
MSRIYVPEELEGRSFPPPRAREIVFDLVSQRDSRLFRGENSIFTYGARRDTRLRLVFAVDMEPSLSCQAICALAL